MTPCPTTLRIYLRSGSDGDQQALDKLMPLVYEELRRQAARYLRRERPGHTLQTTALVNEAYLRLVDAKDVRWQNRAHFFGIAAHLMRRILVDHARRRDADKRGGAQMQRPARRGVAVADGEPTSTCWRSTRRWTGWRHRPAAGARRRAALLRRA